MSYADVLDGVYRAQDARAGWRRALRLIAHHCAASSGLLMLLDRSTGTIEFSLQHGLSDVDRFRLSDDYMPDSGRFRPGDLRLQDLLMHPVGCVRTDTMIGDYDAYLASPAYRHVYSRLGTEHVMGGFVAEQGGRAVAVRLFRSRREGAFQPRDIRRFERLVPHLASSLELVQARVRTGQLADLISHGRIPPGALFCVVDDRCEVALAGAGGAALLSIDANSGRRLVATALERHATVRRSLADGRELIASRIDDPVSGASIGLAGPLCVLYTVGEDEPAWRARRAAARFGLTRAESRLLEALCTLERPSLQAVAERLGVSRETVKTQIRSVFQKAGVGRQADLLRKVLLLGAET